MTALKIGGVTTRALSLVEILVALAVLAAGVLPLYTMFYHSTAQIMAGQDDGLIQNIGTAFSCQVRRFYPTMLPQTASWILLRPDATGKYHLGGMTSVNWVYLPDWEKRPIHLEYQVKKISAVPRNNRLILLQVTWKSPKGKTKSTIFPELISSE